jgi:dsRNA-specific ribonuclease
MSQKTIVFIMFFSSIQSMNISKSILYAFSVKTNGTTPSYDIRTQEGPPHMPMFAASVNFSGKSYYGERKAAKKDSEQAAACAAILSILGNCCFIVRD